MSTMSSQSKIDNWYDTAQVCLNGHGINSRTESNPEHNKDFCVECGAATITTCQHCDAAIKGYFHRRRVMATWSTPADHFSRPSFCEGCGRGFPWTEASLSAARVLSDEIETLTIEEKKLLKGSLEDIVRDTPQTVLASARFKKLGAKGGKEAAEGFKQILIGVVSETAKKIIWS